MSKFFVKDNQINIPVIEILGEDVNHIKNVLRMNIGDCIEICNKENSQNFLCEIQEIENNKIKCKIIEEINKRAESNVKITVFQGLPKADKMELIIQKSVELGVYEITPLAMKRCVVKLNSKDENKKIERWQKISEVAAKQSGRNIVPKINKVIKIDELCKLCKEFDIVLLAYEKEKENSLKNELKKINKKDNIKIAIIIGPEGGFEEEEVEILKQNNGKIVTLGNRILRTETVALNMISVIMYELE